MPLYNIDPAEHTTIERETIIERDSWYGEPWAVALIVGAIAIIGLVAYWALYTPQTPAVVSNTTIERPNPSERAQRFQSSPSVVVTPAPQVTVTPPPAASSSASGSNPPAPSNSTPPVIINNQAGQTPPNQTPPSSGGDQSSAGDGGGNNTTSGG